MRRPIVLCSAALAASLTAFLPAQKPSAVNAQTAQTAGQMMTDAESRAAAAHKNIIVIFSASWCGPCHMLERFFTDSKVMPILDRNFVRVTLDVGEHPGDSRHADTPGGPEFMTDLGGKESGFPFFVITDPTGKPIVDSKLPGRTKFDGNIGYPTTVPQIDWFVQMFQKAAPTLTPKQIKIIRNGLLDQTEH